MPVPVHVAKTEIIVLIYGAIRESIFLIPSPMLSGPDQELEEIHPSTHL
jgi:hypothetical protein